MSENKYGTELTELIAIRGDEPKYMGASDDAEGVRLYRFPDGMEVIETNAGIVTEDMEGFAEARTACMI